MLRTNSRRPARAQAVLPQPRAVPEPRVADGSDAWSSALPRRPDRLPSSCLRRSRSTSDPQATSSRLAERARRRACIISFGLTVHRSTIHPERSRAEASARRPCLSSRLRLRPTARGRGRRRRGRRGSRSRAGDGRGSLQGHAPAHAQRIHVELYVSRIRIEQRGPLQTRRGLAHRAARPGAGGAAPASSARARRRPTACTTRCTEARCTWLESTEREDAASGRARGR